MGEVDVVREGAIEVEQDGLAQFKVCLFKQTVIVGVFIQKSSTQSGPHFGSQVVGDALPNEILQFVLRYLQFFPLLPLCYQRFPPLLLLVVLAVAGFQLLNYHALKVLAESVYIVADLVWFVRPHYHFIQCNAILLDGDCLLYL